MRSSMNKSGHGEKERGYLLITVILILSLCLIFAVIIFDRASRNIRRVGDIEKKTYSTYIAQAGLEHGKRVIMHGTGASFDALLNQPLLTNISFDQGVYTAFLTDNNDDADPNHDSDEIIVLTATGTRYGHTSTIIATIQGTFTSDASKPVGITAKDNVTISGTGSVDSYDSSLGAYGPSNHGSDASVGCNIDITMSGTSDVYGDLVLGNNLSVNGSSHVNGDVSSGSTVTPVSQITGAITQNLSPPPQPFDPAITAMVDQQVANAKINNNNNLLSGSYLKNGTEFSIGGNNSYSFPPGTYYFTKFNISGSGEITNISLGGQVTIFFDGTESMSIAGGGIVNTSANTSQLSIISKSPKITVSGNSAFAGKIIAPYGEVDFSGTADVFGGALAKEVKVSGTGNIHLDVNLPSGFQTNARLTSLETRSWIEQ